MRPPIFSGRCCKGTGNAAITTDAGTKRQARTEIEQLLEEFPAVGVPGPRPVVKTTLAEVMGCEDIKAAKRFVVYPGKEGFPLAKEVTAIPMLDMMNDLKDGK